MVVRVILGAGDDWVLSVPRSTRLTTTKSLAFDDNAIRLLRCNQKENIDSDWYHATTQNLLLFFILSSRSSADVLNIFLSLNSDEIYQKISFRLSVIEESAFFVHHGDTMT